jgi:hypothetical protein
MGELMKNKLFSILLFVVSLFLFAAIMGSVAAQTQFSCSIGNGQRPIAVENGIDFTVEASGNANHSYRAYIIGLPVDNTTHNPIVSINGNRNCMAVANQRFEINLPGLPRNGLQIHANDATTASSEIHYNQSVPISVGYSDHGPNEFMLVLDHLLIHGHRLNNLGSQNLADITVTVGSHLTDIELYVLPSNENFVPHISLSSDANELHYQSYTSQCTETQCELTCQSHHAGSCSPVHTLSISDLFFDDPHHQHRMSHSKIMTLTHITGRGNLTFHLTVPKSHDDHNYTVIARFRLS